MGMVSVSPIDFCEITQRICIGARGVLLFSWVSSTMYFRFERFAMEKEDKKAFALKRSKGLGEQAHQERQWEFLRRCSRAYLMKQEQELEKNNQ